jgi:hypothetical protein
LASIALIGGFILFRCNKGVKKEEFIKTDCQFYEPGKMCIDEYFGKRNDFFIKGITRQEKESTEDKQKDNDVEMNTTRELKDDKNEDVKDRPVSCENKETHRLNEVNELEEINNDKLVIKENKPAPHNDIVLHDNFVSDGVSSVSRSNSKKTTCTNLTQNKTILNRITLKDYLALEFKYVPTYDLRTTLVFLKDEVYNKHRLFSVIQKQSIMDPVIIRSTKLMFYLSSSFASSALLFTDGYIEERIDLKVI